MASAHYDISIGDASLELPLDISEHLDDLRSYTLDVTALNCNGQIGTVCVYVHVYMFVWSERSCGAISMQMKTEVVVHLRCAT